MYATFSVRTNVAGEIAADDWATGVRCGGGGWLNTKQPAPPVLVSPTAFSGGVILVAVVHYVYIVLSLDALSQTHAGH